MTVSRTSFRFSRSSAPLLTEPGHIAYLTSPRCAGSPDHPPWHILMVHANGFVKELWLPLIAELRQRGVSCPITAMDLRSHGDSSPVCMNSWWSDLPKDVMAVITRENSRSESTRPYLWLGVGHSVGGAALIFTESQRPGTFRGLFCYEPVIWTEKLGPVADFASLARKRRNDFATLLEAEHYFRSRALFRSWTEEMIALYSIYALKAQTDRYVLKSDPVNGEARFFDSSNSLPPDAHALIAHIGISIVLLRGERTSGVWGEEHAAHLMRKCFPSCTLHVLPGLGHLGIMEDPVRLCAILSTELPIFMKRNFSKL